MKPSRRVNTPCDHGGMVMPSAVRRCIASGATRRTRQAYYGQACRRYPCQRCMPCDHAASLCSWLIDQGHVRLPRKWHHNRMRPLPPCSCAPVMT